MRKLTIIIVCIIMYLLLIKTTLPVSKTNTYLIDRDSTIIDSVKVVSFKAKKTEKIK